MTHARPVITLFVVAGFLVVSGTGLVTAQDVSVELSPDEVTVEQGEGFEVDVVVVEPEDGVSGYNFEAGVDDTDVAVINGFEAVGEDDQVLGETDVRGVSIRANGFWETALESSSEVVIGTLRVEAVEAGSTDITFVEDETRLFAEGGEGYSLSDSLGMSVEVEGEGDGTENDSDTEEDDTEEDDTEEDEHEDAEDDGEPDRTEENGGGGNVDDSTDGESRGDTGDSDSEERTEDENDSDETTSETTEDEGESSDRNSDDETRDSEVDESDGSADDEETEATETETDKDTSVSEEDDGVEGTGDGEETPETEEENEDGDGTGTQEGGESQEGEQLPGFTAVLGLGSLIMYGLWRRT